MQEYTTNKHQKIGEREAKATVIPQYKTNSAINKIRIFAITNNPMKLYNKHNETNKTTAEMQNVYNACKYMQIKKATPAP